MTVVTAVCSGSPRSPWNPRCKCGRRVSGPPQRLTPTRPGRVLARYSSHLSRWPLPPRRSAQLGIVDPVQLPALAPADAPEYSAAATVTTRLSMPTRDTPAAMRSSHLLARGQPRGYKPSAPSGADYPEPRRLKRASSLRSQQTVTLRKQIQVRDHPRWLKRLLATEIWAPHLSAAHQSSRELVRAPVHGVRPPRPTRGKLVGKLVTAGTSGRGARCGRSTARGRRRASGT